MGDCWSPDWARVRHGWVRSDSDVVALGHSSAALENTRRGYLFSTVFINDVSPGHFNSFISLFAAFYGLTVWNSLTSASRQQPLTGHSSDDWRTLSGAVESLLWFWRRLQMLSCTWLLTISFFTVRYFHASVMSERSLSKCYTCFSHTLPRNPLLTVR